ncbi:nudC domain-containing protein 2 isoform X1 [Iris pallida]|uniref:NudC domain-containing protein 2 isoform X1 n=1 Tax=Iris pallida TaxID=29817 RepID=A0AAX6H5P9_IRIPA|nr:nudC domain-containing protein 2 isoform X1 [Iris pallida]
MGPNPRRSQHLHRSPPKSPHQTLPLQDPAESPRGRDQGESPLSQP